MSGIAGQHFESQEIRFGPIVYEKDPEVESRWTHDALSMRMFDLTPERPMPAVMVRRWDVSFMGIPGKDWLIPDLDGSL